MTDTNIFEERLLPMVAACAPLRVKVTMKCQKNRYYIYFDGTATYADPKKWTILWDGFDRYVKNIVQQQGFRTDSIKMKDETHAVVFIGTLFDFLKSDYNG